MVGKKETVYSKEDMNLANEIIDLYQKQVQPRGKISINSIVNYSIEIFENGTVNKLFKEHFWKRSKGRDLIDKRNQLAEMIPFDVEKANLENVVDTVVTVNKYFDGGKTQKQKMVLSLKRNEENLKKVIRQLSDREKKIEKMELQIVTLEEKNKHLEEKNKILQDTFFTLLDASAELGDNYLFNSKEGGSKGSAIINELFSHAFVSPEEGFKELKMFKSHSKKEELLPNNVINFKERQSILDEFDL